MTSVFGNSAVRTIFYAHDHNNLSWSESWFSMLHGGVLIRAPDRLYKLCKVRLWRLCPTDFQRHLPPWFCAVFVLCLSILWCQQIILPSLVPALLTWPFCQGDSLLSCKTRASVTVDLMTSRLLSVQAVSKGTCKRSVLVEQMTYASKMIGSAKSWSHFEDHDLRMC